MNSEQFLKEIIALASVVKDLIEDKVLKVSQETIAVVFEEVKELDSQGQLSTTIEEAIKDIVVKLAFLAVAAKHTGHRVDEGGTDE